MLPDPEGSSTVAAVSDGCARGFGFVCSGYISDLSEQRDNLMSAQGWHRHQSRPRLARPNSPHRSCFDVVTSAAVRSKSFHQTLVDDDKGLLLLLLWYAVVCKGARLYTWRAGRVRGDAQGCHGAPHGGARCAWVLSGVPGCSGCAGTCSMRVDGRDLDAPGCSVHRVSWCCAPAPRPHPSHHHPTSSYSSSSPTTSSSPCTAADSTSRIRERECGAALCWWVTVWRRRAGQRGRRRCGGWQVHE